MSFSKLGALYIRIDVFEYTHVQLYKIRINNCVTFRFKNIYMKKIAFNFPDISHVT